MNFSSARTHRRRGLAVGASVMMVLAACGGSDDGDAGSIDTLPETIPVDTEVAESPADTAAETTAAETTAPDTTTTTPLEGGSSAEPPATEPPATDPPATDPPATDPPATEPPVTEAPPTPDGADCLIGAWVITNAEMNGFYDAIEAGIGVGDLEISVPSGEVALTLTADTYEYTADFLIDVFVAGTTGSGAAGGSVSGTWEATDGIITTTLGAGALVVEITVGGQTIDGSDMANGFLASVPINDAPFDCAGPTIDFQTGDGTPRHPVLLTPA